MYCSQCGAKAVGKFCHECGHSLEAASGGSLMLRDEDFQPSVAEWEQFTQYDRVIKVSSVRAAIAHYTARAPKGLSGEAVLALYDKVMSSPVPLEKLAGVLQPIYASWGIHTGKERVEEIAAPVGRVIARTLCSLASHGQSYEGVEQQPAGCILSAKLPSSVCALQGKLFVAVMKCRHHTRVKATTDIPGQMFDLGKSQRCLEALFRDLHSEMDLPENPQRHVA